MATQLSAQEQRASKSSYESRNSGSFIRSGRIISLAYGLPNLLFRDYSGPGKTAPSLGPVLGRFEFGVRDEVGIGGQLQLSGKLFRYGSHHDDAFSYSIASMGFYHANKLIPLRWLDVYAMAGLNVQYQYINYDNDYTNARSRTNVSILPIGAIGLRCYLQPNFALFAEGGYTGLSLANLGVTMRM